jgi:hypothetical protein
MAFSRQVSAAKSGARNIKNILLDYEWRALTVVANSVMPSHGTFVSAESVGVMFFLRRAIAGELPGWRRFLPRKKLTTGLAVYREHYRELVRRLDIAAQKSVKKGFVAANPAQQAKLVESLSSGKNVDVGYNVKGIPTATQSSDEELFNLLKRHVMMAYFSDPIHGGNKNYSGWESVNHVCHMNYNKPEPPLCKVTPESGKTP